MSESPHILYDPVPRMICVFCHARMDVSKVAPFSKAICPKCGSEVTVPARLGSFLLTELLGMGGMGGVYRAHDETLGRDVAVKVMLKSIGDNQDFINAFRKEAQAAAKLNHPNIAQIYSFGQAKGQPYIVMELVPGLHFDQMIAGPEPLDIPTVMKIGMDIAEGLQLAAEANLIHGDIKPENILLDDRNQAKLVDFGIASKPSEGEGEIWGTPYYIAPERVRRQRVDFRSDIYCLGGTLYHGITQHPPFEGADAIEVVRARLKGPPTPIETYRPDVDPDVSAIITRMLQVEPAMRYPTYGSLLSDMRAYLSRAQPRTATTKSKRFVIKGSKAAETARTTSTTGLIPGAAASGRLTTGPINARTHGLVVTRGMISDNTPPSSAGGETKGEAPKKSGKWKKGVLVTLLIVLVLGLLGAGGIWFQKRRKDANAAAAEADARNLVARWQTLGSTAQTAIAKGGTDLAGYAAEAAALVTQAVDHVEKELGSDYTARILYEEAPLTVVVPPQESLADGEGSVTNALADADTAVPEGADGSTAAENGTIANAPAAEGNAAASTPVAKDSATVDVPVAAQNVAVENAAAAGDSAVAGATVAEGGAVDAAAAEDGAAVSDIQQPDMEPLPPLAQMARDVFTEAAPLRRALERARALGDEAAAIAAAQAATNGLEAIKSGVQRLQTMATTLQNEAAEAPRIVSAAREKLELLSREITRLAMEREKEAADRQRQEAEQAAAEAEAARQAAELAAIANEIAMVGRAVEAQREALALHQYDAVLGELRQLEKDLVREEGKSALQIATKRVTALLDLRTFLIGRLNEVPFKSFQGWSVQNASKRSLSIRAVNGQVADVPWEKVGLAQMVEFIRFYIDDDQEAARLRLRERHAQHLNGAIYCVTFGEGSQGARNMAASLLQKANTMLPLGREEALRLLPELAAGDGG